MKLEYFYSKTPLDLIFKNGKIYILYNDIMGEVQKTELWLKKDIFDVANFTEFKYKDGNFISSFYVKGLYINF